MIFFALVIVVIFVYVCFWYIKITLKNEKLLIEKLSELRNKYIKDYRDNVFPIITENPTIFARYDLAPWRFLCLFTYSPKSNKWVNYVVSPKGVQATHEINANELIINLPKNKEDLKIGLSGSFPMGFIFSNIIFADEDITINPKKRSINDMELLAEALVKKGAVISK